MGAASPAGADSPEPRIPTIVPGRAFLGEVDASTTPPDTTGAVGTTRYIQLVNSRFAIFTRTGLPLAVGDLNTLFASVANNFDPQIIWDNTTNRFYYVGDNVISSSQNRLAFGFSTTDSPSNGSTHWCHYFLDYGAIFPDYPKLGDSASFVLIGVNNFNPGFLRADLIAIRKPTGTGPITSCPSPASLPVQINAESSQHVGRAGIDACAGVADRYEHLWRGDIQSVSWWRDCKPVHHPSCEPGGQPAGGDF